MAKATKSTIFGTSKGYDIQIGNVYENATPQTLYPRQAARELWKIENVKKNDKYIKQLLEHNDFEINKQLTSQNSNNIMINDKLCLLSRYNLKKYYEDSSEIEMFVYEYLIEQFKYTDDDFVKELKSLELEEIEI